MRVIDIDLRLGTDFLVLSPLGLKESRMLHWALPWKQFGSHKKTISLISYRTSCKQILRLSANWAPGFIEPKCYLLRVRAKVWARARPVGSRHCPFQLKFHSMTSTFGNPPTNRRRISNKTFNLTSHSRFWITTKMFTRLFHKNRNCCRNWWLFISSSTSWRPHCSLEAEK